MKNKTMFLMSKKLLIKTKEIIQSYKGKNFKEYRTSIASLKYDDKHKVLDYPLTVTLEMINRY